MSSMGKDLKSITVAAHALAFTNATAAGSGDATEVDGVSLDTTASAYNGANSVLFAVNARATLTAAQTLTVTADSDDTVRIVGSVTAGSGWTANQDEAAGFEFKPHWQAVLIEGTSAEPVALQGQVVLIDPFLSPRDGRIVVVQTKDGRAFCKRFCAVGEDIVVLSGLNAGRDSVALRKDEIATMHVVVGTVYTDSVAR
jgi:SOS-response transcriptional repressor LexA